MISEVNSERRYGYAEIAENLRVSIEEGRYREGVLLPTERELQDEFDVSRTTVRRGLQALVDMGWAESSPNRGVIARNGPRQNRTANIAFIVHAGTLNRYLFLELNRHLQEKGFHLVHIDSLTHTVEGAINYACENDFACAIIWPMKGYLDPELLDTSSFKLPIINVQHRFPNFETDLVTEDHFHGGFLAAKHLIAQGRKRIAITGMLDMLQTNHQRFSGYMIGIFDSGLSPEVSDYAFCFTSNMAKPDMRTLANRLRDKDRPDAVFVMDDFLVPYVAETIKEAGLSVPEDVAIVAFGNDVPYSFGQTNLSTISINWDLVAEATAKQALARIEGSTLPAQTMALPVELIVRGSCGAPKSEWIDRPFYSHDNNLAYAPSVPHTGYQTRAQINQTFSSDLFKAEGLLKQ